MIQHIVLFKLVNKDSIGPVKTELERLTKLPYPVMLEVVDGFVQNGVEGDLVLNSTFETKGLLDDYMKDPDHLDVINNTSKLIKDKQVIDFVV